MDVLTRSREELKTYFVKNAIPTESNFSELVDGMLNQKDDGLIKLPNEPLKIVAAGDASTEQPAIQLYANIGDSDPQWKIELNGSTGSGVSNRTPGFNIVDGDNTSRLFIDKETGNVGIGVKDPSSRLQIESGDLRVRSNHNNTTADIGRFYAQNLTQGIGIGFNRIEAIGSNENQDIVLTPKGTGKVDVGSTLHFGTNTQQTLNLWGTQYGIGVQFDTCYSRTAINFAWFKSGSHSDAALEAGAGGRLQMVLDGNGNLGIGTNKPLAKIHVEHGNLKVRSTHNNTTADIGIFFAENETQGIGIGYNRIAAIGSNPNQDILLAPKGSGKVSIGTSSGELSVPGAVENLRMLRGIISDAGSKVQGSGFRCTKVRVGLYDIVFDSNFTGVPAVTVSQVFGTLNTGVQVASTNGGSTLDNAVVAHLSRNMIRVKTGGSDGNARDRYFCFIAVGTR